MEFRIEKDTLGEIKVPKNAYFGAQTQRAVENFKASSLRLQPAFIRAQAIIKRAAALENIKAGRLKKNIGEALVKAADEIISFKYIDQFVVDVFQAGAGTSQNMNINEVLANRAEEILGGNLGNYSQVHPNDHANMSQSTNDTFHTAIHIAAYTEIKEHLIPVVADLEENLHKKSREFFEVIKAGRTHLQDAVPMRLGQEFDGYKGMIQRSRKHIEQSADILLELCIGGTAIGTGLNTDAAYRKNVIANINEATGYPFRAAPNIFEAMQSLNAIIEVTGALRVLIANLRKIADDLRLLSSGPNTGFAEITLPAVQPGSSIMPGKVNPVLPEMLNMVCFQAIGCDNTILNAAQAGQLELNVMMPVVAYNLLLEIEILSGGIQSFTERCVTGIKANKERCRFYAERSATLATVLTPFIGYDRTAEIVKEALLQNRSIKEIALSKEIMDSQKIENLLDLDKIV